MGGYNIQCDPGDLYSRKCYTVRCTDAGGADCTCGAAGCVNEIREEIIGYTSGGDPVSKGASGSSWMAWIPSLTSLNLQGNPYRPYGEAGLPYTMGGGIAGVGGIMPSTGADSQDWYYLTEVVPGAQSRKMYQRRICNPLWPTFGCRVGTPPEVETEESETFIDKLKNLFSAEDKEEYSMIEIIGVGTIVTAFFVWAIPKLPIFVLSEKRDG